MRFVALALFALLAAPAYADLSDREGGPTRDAMIARTTSGAPEGVAFFRPVLDGVLYRGGFSGGDKGRTGLSASQRTQLCSAGFSKGFYADFGKNTDYGATSCGAGSFDYQSARSSRPAGVMQAIYGVIKSPDEGPVLFWKKVADPLGLSILFWPFISRLERKSQRKKVVPIVVVLSSQP